MPQGSPGERHDRSGFAALAPSLAILAVGGVLLFIILLWLSVRQADQLELAKEKSMVSNALLRSIDGIAYEQESSTIWTEAARQVVLDPIDLKWVDDNLGVWFYSYYGHDEVFILSPSGAPVYAMEEGRRAPLTSFRGETAKVVLPLEADLKRLRAHPRPFNGRLFSPGSADFAVVAGHPAAVSLKPIMPERGADRRLDRGFLHVSIVFLDHRFAKALTRDLQIEDPRFSVAAPVSGPAVALRRSDGVVLGYFTWTPFRPGTLIAQRIAPVAIVALFLIGAFVAFLAVHLRRRTSQLRGSEARVHYLASHDPLTGLLNRRRFEERVVRQLGNSRKEGEQAAYLRIDVDGLQSLNDRLGRSGGDELIRRIARKLAESVGAGHAIARTGGNEFSILHTGGRGPADIEALCRRILAPFRDPVRIDAAEARVSLSIGIALHTEQAMPLTELARRADLALQEARAAGGGWAFFSRGMEASRREQQEMEAEARTAVLTGESLSIRYHPIVAASDLRIVGAEAKLHWQRAGHGSVPSTTFMSIVHHIGLGRELSRRLIQEMAATIRAWPAYTYAVGITEADVQREGFATEFLATLQELDLPPASLELRITAVQGPGTDGGLAEACRHLRASGIAICMESAGMPFLPFMQIKERVADRVLIGESLVSALSAGSEAFAILRWITEAARASGLTIAAAGVKTQEQRECLLGAGCVALQGPLFGEAMAKEEFTALLTDAGPPLAPSGA